MGYTFKDIYDSYIEENGYIDKSIFADICHTFNIGIIDHILDGKTFNMGNNLSTISVVRRERDFRSPRVNWGESNKYKKELLDKGEEIYDSITELGTKWFIYHTDEFYCKYYWNKGKCKVPNKSVYRIDATRGLKGNKDKLIDILKEDDLDYLKFKKH